MTTGDFSKTGGHFCGVAPAELGGTNHCMRSESAEPLTGSASVERSFARNYHLSGA
jgi:hypothetical protein